jgi:hypothetical protein
MVAPIAWFANPLLWAAYVAGWLHHPAVAAVLGGSAMACAAIGVFIFLNTTPSVCFGCETSGGRGWQVLIAVPVWIASMAIDVASSTLRIRHARSASRAG